MLAGPTGLSTGLGGIVGGMPNVGLECVLQLPPVQLQLYGAPVTFTAEGRNRVFTAIASLAGAAHVYAGALSFIVELALTRAIVVAVDVELSSQVHVILGIHCAFRGDR